MMRPCTLSDALHASQRFEIQNSQDFKFSAANTTPGITATLAGHEMANRTFGLVLGTHLIVATLAFDEMVGAGVIIIANSGTGARLAHVREHFPTCVTLREDTMNSVESGT